jgi:hypothetical protein
MTDLESEFERMVSLLSQVKTAWNEGRHDEALLCMKEVFETYKKPSEKDRELLDEAFADEIEKAERMVHGPNY